MQLRSVREDCRQKPHARPRSASLTLPSGFEVFSAPCRICAKISTSDKESKEFSRLRICHSCSARVDRNCGKCKKDLMPQKDLNWCSGLCDECYACLPQCKECATQLRVKELKFKTGLCDRCWNSGEKKCKGCETPLTLGQMGWCTGLCNACYDKGKESCRLCNSKIRVDEIGWRTGICNECFDKEGCCKQKVSSKGRRLGFCDACYQHCNKNCMRCQETIPDEELRWSSGLCDMCFKDVKRVCEDCNQRIPMKQLRWRSGICDSCYHRRPQSCRWCQDVIQGDDTYHGVRLCNKCFNNCLTFREKTCATCKSAQLVIGDPYWAIGLCTECFEGSSKAPWDLPPRFRKKKTADLGTHPNIYDVKALALQPRSQDPPPGCSHFLDSPTFMILFFAIVGISGWFSFNAVFAMLPVFVKANGKSVVTSISMSNQIGTLLAMSYYSLLTRRDTEQLRREDNDKVSTQRREFNKARRDKNSLARAKRTMHMCQCIAFLNMLVFALVWSLKDGNPDTWTLVLLAVLNGFVGNSSDLNVYCIALQHPSACATSIQFGGCLSGMLSLVNSFFIYQGTVGVTSFFLLVGLLQLFFWLVMCRDSIAGCPVVFRQKRERKRKTVCSCQGCQGCRFKARDLEQVASLGTDMREPLMLTSQETVKPACLHGGISKSDDPANCCGGKNSLCSHEGVKHMFSLPSISDEHGLARMLMTIVFIASGMMYTVPNVFPYMVEAYKKHDTIYNSMNQMYNLGQMVGSGFFLLVPSFTPQEWQFVLGLIVFLSACAICCLGAVIPKYLAEVLPEYVAEVAMPGIVLILLLSTRFLLTGSFKRAHQMVQAKGAPPELTSSMAFYGQVACVGGNFAMFALLQLDVM